MSEDMYDYMDNMLGEKTVAVNSPNGRRAERNGDVTSIQTDSKSSIHPLWKLIDTWGGTISLKARQLTLWGIEP